ncbi:MAG: septal ring lytic transglycosylase RlpA family lipoprotein [Alphaproteobacteria bacterium CG_4_10_14_0_8_um_filter_53_9]|nr:MAG: septal ring lytic transglycosylase RlpA family lipoprotein [Alphaproteobacteria bacterium CG_4_10_14_0_8_um_filter_53_9]
MRLFFLLVPLFLSACTQVQVGSHLLKSQMAGQSCAAEGALKVGNPYKVDGIKYEPIESSLGYEEKGIASWYGSDFHGKATANGECYNMYAFTAAHKTLPLPTTVRVTNLENDKSIVVKVNDRGPFVRGRIIDLSYAAAQSLGMVGGGTAPVLIEAVGGPHHNRGGASSLARKAVQKPGALATLPSFVPSAVEESSLDDTPLPGQRIIAKPLLEDEKILPGTELAAAEELLPPKAKALPLPPPDAQVPARNYKALQHTKAFIQVGAYGNEAAALSQKDKLKILNNSAFVQPVQRGSSMLHRVRVGPFNSTGEAETFLTEAINQGFTAATIVIEEE